jgi:hypothetical protein
MKPQTPSSRQYSVHPASVMTQEWLVALPQRTGRTIQEWTAIAQSSGLKEKKELAKWLKEEFSFGTNQALWVAEFALGEEDSIAMSTDEGYMRAAERWIDEQYSGKKQHLRPVYEKVLDTAFQISPEVKASPTKTYCSLFRHYAFAQIKPTTNTRIDIGLALQDEPIVGKITDTGGAKKGDCITHRISVQSSEDIDDEVEHWLRLAFTKDVAK